METWLSGAKRLRPVTELERERPAFSREFHVSTQHEKNSRAHGENKHTHTHGARYLQARQLLELTKTMVPPSPTSALKSCQLFNATTPLVGAAVPPPFAPALPAATLSKPPSPSPSSSSSSSSSSSHGSSSSPLAPPSQPQERFVFPGNPYLAAKTSRAAACRGPWVSSARQRAVPVTGVDGSCAAIV